MKREIIREMKDSIPPVENSFLVCVMAINTKITSPGSVVTEVLHWKTSNKALTYTEKVANMTYIITIMQWYTLWTTV